MIGKKIWTIGDGFMSDTEKGGYVSHEAVCVLNLSENTAEIRLTIYFEDKKPLKGFKAVCESERTNLIYALIKFKMIRVKKYRIMFLMLYWLKAASL